MEDQGQSSNIPLLEYTQGFATGDHEIMSPDFPLASSSNIYMEEDKEDKDESWMQFITDDAWGAEEMSHVSFT